MLLGSTDWDPIGSGWRRTRLAALCAARPLDFRLQIGEARSVTMIRTLLAPPLAHRQAGDAATLLAPCLIHSRHSLPTSLSSCCVSKPERLHSCGPVHVSVVRRSCCSGLSCCGLVGHVHSRLGD